MPAGNLVMIIKNAAYLVSSPSVEKCPKADKPEYAFIGRSNVGKSSLINMLCNNQKLAKTSASPGKTKLINHFLINKAWYLVDLPGYGFAKASQAERKSWAKMIEEYLRKRENLVNVFVLIDGRHTPQKIDLDFVNKLGEWKIPFTLAFTKTDKAKPDVLKMNIKSFLDAMSETWQFLPRHFITSAEKKSGKEELLQFINECNKKLADKEA